MFQLLVTILRQAGAAAADCRRRQVIADPLPPQPGWLRRGRLMACLRPS